MWNNMFQSREKTPYHFTMVTPCGRETVDSYKMLKDKLDELEKTKEGFVRLEITPPIDGKRYLETIYDKTKKHFYVCILEDREEGQGFLEYWDNVVPKRQYKHLLEKHNFGLALLLFFMKSETGIQRRVTAQGVEENIYMVPFEKKSCICDDVGSYGGAQQRPVGVCADSDEGKRIRKIIHKYYPLYNDAQQQALLERLYSEGCGYTVVVNILFAHFQGREKEFEEKFGFPMYGSNGDLNYNLLLVDFYAATDNHDCVMGIDTIDYTEDQSEEEKNDDYDYRMDTTGKGTTQEERNYRTHLYLDGKGIKIKITNHITMPPGKFRELSQTGYVLMSLASGNLRYDDRSIYDYITRHGMLITGITYDCKYIVSSWGNKYLVDPNEVFEEKDKKTELYYQYFEFL